MQAGKFVRGAARGPLIIRHHPVLLLARAWRPAGLLLAAAVLVVVLAAAPAGAAPPAIWAGLAGGLFLVGGLWAAWCYLDWSYDLLFLTEHRLIEVSGVAGFTEARREMRLERIQSVELDVRNPIMRWCGCADIVISIAAVGPLRFAAARDPLLVRDRILARLDERKGARAQIDEGAIRASVEALLARDETPVLPETEDGRRKTEERGREAGGQGGRKRTRRARIPSSVFRLPSSAPRPVGVAWHRHPWFLLRSWLAPSALVAAGAAIPFLLDNPILAPALPLAGPITLCLVVAALAWMWWLWADWRNDHYVVTPDRLIEIEQLPLGLRQQLTEAALDKVQDIRYLIPHPLASLLNYGDVIVRTASANQPFIFRGIARPRQLAAQIDRHVTAMRLAEEQGRHDALRSEFARWLVAYDDLSAARGETV